MTKITDHFQITDAVPFLDVDVTVDNRLFLDPCAVRLQHPSNLFAAQANRATESFFAEVVRCALSPSVPDRNRGLDLLQHFTEPWETRLGLAEKGFQGHGGAEDVGSAIWEALVTDVYAFVRVGLLRQIEDIPLFVDGIDRDITSDITTRIVYEALTDFTASIIDTFPQFRAEPHHTVEVERQIWDSGTLGWTTKKVTLPLVDDKALLLIPRDWARPTLLMSAGRYYDTSVLSYAQDLQAVTTNEGKVLKTPKRVLRLQDDLSRTRETNLQLTLRAHHRNENLIAQFKAFVASRYEPLTDEEIARRVA